MKESIFLVPSHQNQGLPPQQTSELLTGRLEGESPQERHWDWSVVCLTTEVESLWEDNVVVMELCRGCVLEIMCMYVETISNFVGKSSMHRLGYI